jgi:hypothetical protein
MAVKIGFAWEDWWKVLRKWRKVGWSIPTVERRGA